MTTFHLCESVFVVMREIGAESERRLQRGRDLSPRFGEIAVGGGHFDEFVAGEALASFLRALRKGADPGAAVDVAKASARECVATWNRQRGCDYVVHRSAGTVDSLIEHAAYRIRCAVPVGQGSLFAA